MLHHGGKDKRRDKRYAQRVGHSLVVLLEGVLVDVQSQLLVQVLEEDASHIVTLTDDDGVLLAELVEIGKCRAEHRVRGDIRMASLLVELPEIGLHGADVADDAVLGYIRQYFLECRYGVFHRHGIDKQLGLEVSNLVDRRETLAVICEAQPLGILLEHGHLMVEGEQVDKEASHLSCSHNQYFHFLMLLMISTVC